MGLCAVSEGLNLSSPISSPGGPVINPVQPGSFDQPTVDTHRLFCDHCIGLILIAVLLVLLVRRG